MKTLLRIVLLLTFCSGAFVFPSCSSSTIVDDSNALPLSGMLVYDKPSATSDIATYNFSTKREAIIFSGGLCPSWTPSGEVLYEEASEVVQGIDWKIVKIGSNGINKQVLLDSKKQGLNVKKNPRMSKDGSMICFNFWLRSTGINEMYTGHATILMKSDGTVLGAIDSLFDGTWLPDGSLVLSATIDEAYATHTYYAEGLYRLSSDGKSLTPVGSGLVKPKHPAASPDGKQIAFSMNSHIWVINTDGSGLRQISTGSKEELHPCWSPDGKYIACTSDGMFEFSVYTAMAVMPATSATLIDLTNASPYWVIDPSRSSGSEPGRVNPLVTISWK